MKCNCGRDIGKAESECSLCEKLRGDALIDFKAEMMQ